MYFHNRSSTHFKFGMKCLSFIKWSIGDSLLFKLSNRRWSRTSVNIRKGQMECDSFEALIYLKCNMRFWSLSDVMTADINRNIVEDEDEEESNDGDSDDEW